VFCFSPLSKKCLETVLQSYKYYFNLRRCGEKKQFFLTKKQKNAENPKKKRILAT
jgi:hypothetical protein